MRSDNESSGWREVNGGCGYDVLRKGPMHEVGAWRNMTVDEVPMGSDKGSDGYGHHGMGSVALMASDGVRWSPIWYGGIVWHTRRRE